MDHQCIDYVTDLEYAFPTILSALQARAFAAPDTDVLILTFETLANDDAVVEVLAEAGVILIDASKPLQEALGRLDRRYFAGRISVSTMAKLVLPDVLPDRYTQVIYLDGDTQIVGSLAQLECSYVPEGRFFAARDYTAIHDVLVNGTDSHYFNAGVLKFHRSSWIGKEALALFERDPEACGGKHDQGALNEVAGPALMLISNRWNFPKQFLHLVPMSNLSIVHYMAHPKPWHGTFFPWTAKESGVYKELRRKHPAIAALYRGIGLNRRLLYTYRSARQRIAHLADRSPANPRIEDLFVGEYAA
ncbi:MAG: glycosyltransferase [Nisaea sp.]|uniref:glycosyltransferase family 8 protein n=1 Tax=Nisaea sp. TaxID=2024842 RepID=UPI00326389F5